MASRDPDLSALFDTAGAERAVTRITERAGDHLRRGVARRTPVARKPGGATQGEWLKAREGRTPGTGRRSWEEGPVERTGPQARAVEVYTYDEAMRFVEDDTAPHLIRARAGAVLRFWDAVGARFAGTVEHPGTTGAHMMRDALDALEEEWVRLGEEEVTRWARTYGSSR